MNTVKTIAEQYMADNGAKLVTVGTGAKINAIGGGSNPKSGVTYEIVFSDDASYTPAVAEFKNKKGFPEPCIMLYDSDAEQMRRLGLFAFDERCKTRWTEDQWKKLDNITIKDLAEFLKAGELKHLAVGAPVEITFKEGSPAVSIPTLTFVK